MFRVIRGLRQRERLFVALLLVNLGMVATSLYVWPGSPAAILASVGGFVWLTVVPGLLMRLAGGALRSGKLRTARRLLRLRSLFEPSAAASRDRQALEVLAMLRQGRVDAASLMLQEQIAQCANPRLRVALVEQLFSLEAYARRYQGLLDRLDALGGEQLARASPSVCAVIIRACGETHDFDAMFRYQTILESTRSALAPHLAHAVNGARVAYLAHLGCVDQLERVFEGDPRFLPPMQPMHHALWFGLAHARAGDSATAGELFARAIKESDDPAVRDVAEKRIEVDLHRPYAPGDQQLRLADEVTERALAYRAVPRHSGQIWRLAPLTTVLLAVVVAVQVFVQLAMILDDGWELVRLGANFSAAVRAGQYWRLVSSMFLHGNWLHLIFNGYALYVLGRLVEQIFGSLRFFPIYLLAGVSGSLASALATTDSHRLSVGASGAIFGLIGAALVALRVLRGFVPEGWRRQLGINLLVIVALQLYIGFSVSVIDNAAHIGGLVGGALAALALRPALGAPVVPHRWMLRAAFVLGGIALVACGVLAAHRGLDQTLAQLPRRTVERGGLSANVPAYWTDVEDAEGLAMSDALTGLVQPPTFEAYSLGSVVGRGLSDYAQEYDRQLYERWSESREVAQATWREPGRVIADDLHRSVLALKIGQRWYLIVSFLRRSKETLLLGRFNLPGRRLTLYEPLMRDVLRSLALSDG